MSKYIKKNLTIEEKFINYIMQDGKKSIANKIFQNMLEVLKKNGHKDPTATFKKGLENICPSIEVRPRRVGGSVYQIPIEVVGTRRLSLGMRWLLAATNGKKGKPMYEKLAGEIILALDNQGNAMKKKDDVHKMAKANKAFAHLARYTR